MAPFPMAGFACACMGQAIEWMHKALDAKLRSLLGIAGEGHHDVRGCIYPIAHTPHNHGHSFDEGHAKQSIRIWLSYNENY